VGKAFVRTLKFDPEANPAIVRTVTDESGKLAREKGKVHLALMESGPGPPKVVRKMGGGEGGFPWVYLKKEEDRRKQKDH